MLGYPEGTRYTVLAPILLREDRTMKQQLDIDMKQGFNRLEVNGEMIRIDEYEPKKGDTVFLLIDRMVASKEKDAVSRLTDSAETAMYEGDGACLFGSISLTEQPACIASALNSKQTVLLLKSRATRCFPSTPHRCLP